MEHAADLLKAYKEWCEASCETPSLVLESDFSGCLRMSEWMGDWELVRSVLSWDKIEDAPRILREDIEQGFPGLEKFKDEADPSRVSRRKRRELAALIQRNAAPAATPAATPTGTPAAAPTDTAVTADATGG